MGHFLKLQIDYFFFTLGRLFVNQLNKDINYDSIIMLIYSDNNEISMLN